MAKENGQIIPLKSGKIKLTLILTIFFLLSEPFFMAQKYLCTFNAKMDRDVMNLKNCCQRSYYITKLF
jgi:hypothetical protein